jgi:hypothetical protein
MEDGYCHSSCCLAGQHIGPVVAQSFHKQPAFFTASTSYCSGYSNSSYLGGYASAGKNSQAVALIASKGGYQNEYT